jgi:cysteine desulfurase/selenocysteine lyase
MRTGGRADGQTGHLVPLDVERVREDFPILARANRGRRLAYLDSAATAQKPRVVLDVMRDFYLHHNANIARSVHQLSEEATTAYEDAREAVRRFLNAERAEEIIFTSGTTAAINMVAQAWGGATLHAGDEVIVTGYEHHSNFVPWQTVAHRTGAAFRVVPVAEDGTLDLAAYRAMLGPRTRVVALSHASNVLGTVTPIAEMARLAHQAGAIVVVDGAQAVPHMPVDVQALDVDCYAFSGHKLYGPTGIGVLYGRHQLLRRMPPWQTGGGMIEQVTVESTTWAPPPARFEAGTPAVAEAIGLAAAIRYLEELGLDAIAESEERVLAYALDRLAEVPGLRLLGSAPHRIGVLSFVLGEIHPHDLGTVLDVAGVAVRAGHHCAQPLMRTLRLPATVRASLGVYTTREDIDQLVTGLHGALERFAR